MSDVDYMKYAQYMGQRNPIASGLNDIGQTLDDNQKRQMQMEQLRMQQQSQDRQNRLADMQLSQYAKEEQYQTGLEGAMANPQSKTSIAPAVAPKQSLSGMMTPAALQPQGEFALPQEPASPTVQAYNEGRVSTKTETPAQAGMKYA